MRLKLVYVVQALFVTQDYSWSEEINWISWYGAIMLRY